MNRAGFKWVLLFQLCYLIQNANLRKTESVPQPADSQSEENESEVEEPPRRHHHRRKYRQPDEGYDMERPGKQNVYNYEDECNNCACNKCDNPPDCCKAVCQSCYLQKHFPMMSMPDMSMSMQMPPMPMQMPMPMPGMPMMGMPMAGMPVPGVPMSLMQMGPPSPFGGPGVVYIGVPPALANLLDNKQESSSTTQAPTDTHHADSASTTTATAGTTPTANATTAASTTIASTLPTNATTKTTQSTTLSTLGPSIRAQNTLRGSNVHRPSLPCQTDKENNKRIALVLENAIDAFTKIIKGPDAGINRRSQNDNFVLASPLRRTKGLGSDAPKYGVVQIPSNVAQRLLFQMRNAKDIRRTL